MRSNHPPSLSHKYVAQSFIIISSLYQIHHRHHTTVQFHSQGQKTKKNEFRFNQEEVSANSLKRVHTKKTKTKMHNFFGGGFPGGFPGGMPGGHQRRNPNEKPEDKDVRRRRKSPTHSILRQSKLCTIKLSTLTHHCQHLPKHMHTHIHTHSTSQILSTPLPL